ncbi:MAG TPA: DUF4241 domain-containing protein [Chloroflexaceae bacterium]|nr:DUF4241 domain-containing protein [Chloroflexaceae bacterium]
MSLRPEQFLSYLTAERTIGGPGGVAARTAARTIGELRLSSGALVACDPALVEARPMGERFPIGAFPVAIVVVTYAPRPTLLSRLAGGLLPPPQPDRRIALAAITFSAAPIVAWRPATERLAPGEAEAEPYVYAVDSATGCFMDLLAAERAVAAGGDLEAAAAIASESAEGEPAWLTMSLRDAPHLNIVAFSSGWGDGAYATYVGYTERQGVARVVTDFNVL